MTLFHLVWSFLDLAWGVALVAVGGAYIPSFFLTGLPMETLTRLKMMNKETGDRK